MPVATKSRAAAKNRAEGERALLAGLKKGHVTFVLDGAKLKGEFALIQLKRSEDKASLLVKKRDQFAPELVSDNTHIDPPGTYDAAYEPFAIEGDAVVAVGTSRYFTDPTRATLDREYHNCYLMHFAPDGRCRSFTEYFMRTPG